ncbi:MAG: hypothetical protein LBL73_07120 [Synergistaceae bacterium]|jgi:hypothetical protein|nr:hypothetical protein [Synergistaceae bacterium]
MAEPAIIERAIGDINLEVTIEERHDDTLTITEHPVEKGAAISDHAYKNPMAVTVTAGMSGKTGDGVPTETYEKLLALQESREPFSIVTGKREYENMLLQGISVTTDADTGNVLMVTLDCREVIIVSTETAQVPPSRQGQAPKTQKAQQAGTKQAQESGEGDDVKKTSVMNSLFGGGR